MIYCRTTIFLTSNFLKKKSTCWNIFGFANVNCKLLKFHHRKQVHWRCRISSISSCVQINIVTFIVGYRNLSFVLTKRHKIISLNHNGFNIIVVRKKSLRLISDADIGFTRKIQNRNWGNNCNNLHCHLGIICIWKML